MLELYHHSGVVRYPLLVFSIIAVAIILERFWTLAYLRRLEEQAYTILKGDPSTDTLQRPEINAAPAAVILQALLPLRGTSEETIGQAAEIALALQRLRLRRFLGTLATIGSTSPFIGLFGTVLGVMLAFQGMSHGGLSGDAMAGGISESLSATALGLLVAVPSIIAYNYFNGRIGAQLLQVQAHVALLAPRVLRAAAVLEEVS
jgi:biopolymer transport protein ExbB